MADRPRVLIFSTAYAPFVGGAEIAVKEITDRIPDMEFVMLTARLRPDLPVHEKIGNVDVYRIGKGNRWDKIRLIWEGPKKAKELGTFNLVWSIMASYSGFAALRYKKKNPTVPYLLTLQEGDSKVHIYSRVWFVWPWFRQIFTKADGLQTISNYLLDWGSQMGFSSNKLSKVIHNGVDSVFLNTFSKFSTESAKNNIRHQEFGINHEGPLILTVSRLETKNNVSTLIQSLKFLDKKYHLAIAGNGSMNKKLQNEVKKNQLGSRVHFLGLVPHEKIPYLYAVSTVFCRPSRSEGLGNVFLEAFASRVPVVASSVGGIPDIIKDGETGLFANPNDSQDIANKIMQAVSDTKVLVENAHKSLRQVFDWDMIASQMGEFMKQLMQKNI